MWLFRGKGGKTHRKSVGWKKRPGDMSLCAQPKGGKTPGEEAGGGGEFVSQ